MQRFFLSMLAIVLMGSLTASWGSDDDTTTALGNYTIGMTISDKGTMSDAEYDLLVLALQGMEETLTNVSESTARTAFEASFGGINAAVLDTSKNYTLEYYLKDSNGKKIAVHYVYVKDGKVTKQ